MAASIMIKTASIAQQISQQNARNTLNASRPESPYASAVQPAVLQADIVGSKISDGTSKAYRINIQA